MSTTALAAGVAAAVAGCSSAPQQTGGVQASAAPSTAQASVSIPDTVVPNAVPAGAAGTPRGGTPKVTDTDPLSVGRGVAVALFTYDTHLDKSPQDAARRAAAWMDPTLGQQQRQATVAGEGAWWNALAAGDGWTTATAVKDTEPAPSSATEVDSKWLVTVTPHLAGSSSSAKPTVAAQTWEVLVVVVKDRTGKWRVSQLAEAPEPGE